MITEEEYYKIKNDILKKENKISIVIPCHYKHFRYIHNLLLTYNKQTVLPYEIIIVISEYFRLNAKIIKDIDKHDYGFIVKIIKIRPKSPAGKNRFLGSKEAEGDIIIFQDADDLPHFQRNEIIQKCFMKYPEIVHILHGFSRHVDNTYYNLEHMEIPSIILNHNIFLNHKEMASYNLTNGNMAIRKKIVNDIDWDIKKFRGQDVSLNKNIYKKYGQYMIIKMKLYTYRENLTSKYFH